MQQFFSREILREGLRFRLPEEERHHLITVLRMRDGEEIRVVDGGKTPFLCRIHPEKKALDCEVLERLSECRETPIPVILALASIKRERWEWALQKSTELGVSRIIPLVTDRTVVKYDDKKRERQEKILVEAAEQSERHAVPALSDSLRLCDAPSALSGTVFFCSERSDAQPLIQAVGAALARRGDADRYEPLTVVVGPEGGFTDAEKDLAEEAGWIPVSLGPRILRAETAAVFAAGLLAQFADNEKDVS